MLSILIEITQKQKKWNEHEMSITELPKWETSEGRKDIYKIWQREPVFGALG